MRLCLLTQQYRYLWSGVGTYTTQLAEGLADAGHEVTVICPQEIGRESHSRIRLITVSKIRLDPSPGKWFSLSYKFSRLLPGLLQKEKFDLVHFTDAREALFCPKIGVPVVGTVHDCYFAEASGNPLSFRHHYHDWFRRYLYYQAVRRLEPRAYDKLDGIIATSRYVKETVIRRYSVPTPNLQLIYYGIELDRSGAARVGRTPGGETRLLFVGTNFQRKGLPTLLRALPQVLIRNPRVRLYVIGKDPNEEAMRRLCRRLRIEPRVEFLGWRSQTEIRNFFARAELFVMPSLIENFAFVFLEAMACGVPVIGSSVGGIRELIKDGVNGFLVKPLDVQGLAQKVCTILENKSLREQLILQGFQTVKGFTAKHMVEQTISYYEKKCAS